MGISFKQLREQNKEYDGYSDAHFLEIISEHAGMDIDELATLTGYAKPQPPAPQPEPESNGFMDTAKSAGSSLVDAATAPARGLLNLFSSEEKPSIGQQAEALGNENNAAREMGGAPVRQSVYNQAVADQLDGRANPNAQGLNKRIQDTAAQDFRGQQRRSGIDKAINDEFIPGDPEALDYAKGMASGANQLVSGIGYITELLGADETGKAIRKQGDMGAQFWNKSMTQSGQVAAGEQVFIDDEESITGLRLSDRWGSALLMGAAQSLPSMLAAGGPGALAAKGIQKLASLGLAGGAGATIPLLAGTAAPVTLGANITARIPAAVGFGAAEGVTAGSMNAAGLKSSIEGMSFGELEKSPIFRTLSLQHGKKKARELIAEQASKDVFTTTSLATGTIGALTGGGALAQAYQKVTAGSKGGVISQTVKGSAQEAFQEAPQSGSEALIENIATRDYLDPSQNITEGVASQAASGAAIGAATGAVFGGGGAIQNRASRIAAEREKLQRMRPQDAVAGAAQANAEQSKAAVDNIAKASSVDEAINAANTAVNQKPVTSRDVWDSIQTKDQLLKQAEEAGISNQPQGDINGENTQEQTEAAPDSRILDNARGSDIKGNTSEIVLPDNSSLPFEWSIVDADEVSATMKENVNQPRDRSRIASDAQIISIANNPDYRRLSDSPVMDVGAPVLSKDGLIVAGNGRFEGISRSYDSNNASYRSSLDADATNKGIDPASYSHMNRPVLVRKITQDADTRKLAVSSNSGGGLQYSGMELSRVDAGRMSGLINLELTDDGDVSLTNKNLDKVRGVLSDYTTSEVAAFIDSDGQLSQEGVRRVRNAILYSAYDYSPVLSRMIESADHDMRRVIGALTINAGAAAKVKSRIKQGNIPKDLDITDDILSAVEELTKIKSTGAPVDQYLSQQSLFGDEISQDSKDIIKFIADNMRSQKKMSEFFAALYDGVNSISASESLFDDIAPPNKKDVINNATGKNTSTEPSQENRQERKVKADTKSSATENKDERLIPLSKRSKKEDINLGKDELSINDDDIPTDAFNDEDIDTIGHVGQFYGSLAKTANTSQDINYEKIQQRPSTTEKQREQGQLAFRDFERHFNRRTGGRIVASSIPKDFKEKGGSTLIGQKVASAGDLAVAAQTLRDPRFETFRVVYVKDGKVIHHSGITSRMPGSVQVIIAKDGEKMGDAWKRYTDTINGTMKKTGAQGYYLLHNHPSGNSDPSEADISFTRKVQKDAPGMIAHVVINSNEYSVLGGEHSLIPETTKKELTGGYTNGASIPHNALKIKITRDDQIAEIGKLVEQKEGFFTAIGLNAKLEVVSIAEVPMSVMDKSEMFQLSVLRSFARNSGATSVSVVTDKKDMKRFNAAAFEEVLVNVVSTEGEVNFLSSGEQRLFETGKKRAIGVNEKKDNDQLLKRKSAEPKPETTNEDDAHFNEIKAAVDELTDNWEQGSSVKVVRLVSDLSQFLGQAVTDRLPSDVDGLYDPATDTVYIISGNIPHPHRAKWVTIHEVVGHGGIRKLNKSVNDSVELAGRNKFIRDLASAISKRREEPYNKSVHIQEAIAELAAASLTKDTRRLFLEYGVKVPTEAHSRVESIIERLVEAIRSFLTKVLGQTTNAEIRDLITAMKIATEQGRENTESDEFIRQSLMIVRKGYQTVNNFVIPETEEYADNFTGDLARIRGTSAVPGGPLRVEIGAAKGDHIGSGLMHIVHNVIKDPKRRMHVKTEKDIAENVMRGTVATMKGVRDIYLDKNVYIMVDPKAKRAIVTEFKNGYHTVITERPHIEDSRKKYGSPRWTGRLTFPVQSSSATASVLPLPGDKQGISTQAVSGPLSNVNTSNPSSSSNDTSPNREGNGQVAPRRKISISKKGELIQSKDDNDSPLLSRSDADTITIDGVERPTKNSEGKSIHPTKEGIRNFWKWFGDSKVVDGHGRPQVLYHQTSIENESSILKEGFRTDNPRARKSDPRVPDGVFLKPTKDDIGVGAAKEEGVSQIPLYLKLENPLKADTAEDIERKLDSDDYALAIINHKEKEQRRGDEFRKKKSERADGHDGWAVFKKWSDGYFIKAFAEGERTAGEAREILTRELRKKDHDGVIVDSDEGSFGRSTVTYIALDANQIKSAINNKGSFSKDDDGVLMSRAASLSDAGVNTEAEPTADNALPSETGMQAFRRRTQDAMIRFKVVQDWLKKNGIDISEAANVYQRENISKGKMANKIEDFREKELKPLIKRIAKQSKLSPKEGKFDLEDIVTYLEAVHIPEANAKMREIHKKPDATANGITDAQAKKIQSDFEAMPNFTEFKKLAEEVRNIGSVTLDMRLDAGMISQEQYDNYKKAYKNWVPLRGNQDPKGSGKGLSVVSKDKRRLGHNLRDSEMILENLVQAREKAIMEVEKNKVALTVAQFILEAKNEAIGTINKPEKMATIRDFSYNVNYKGQTLATFQTKGAADAAVLRVMAKGIDGVAKANTLSREDFDVIKTHDPIVTMTARPMLAENEIQAYVNGHTVRMQLNDDMLARAATAGGIEQVGAILQGSRMFLRFLSKTYTAWNPDFTTSNMIRDLHSGSLVITGKKGALFTAKTVANYPVAMAELMKAYNDPSNSKWVQRYRDAGGNIGAAYLDDLERVGRDSQAALQEYAGARETYRMVFNEQMGKGSSKSKARTMATMKSGLAKAKVIPIVGNLFEIIEKVNAIVENTLRLAAFKTSIENGESDQEAATLSKDLMNFNRKGEMANQVGSWYIFYNPAMQGIHIFGEALFTSKHKAQVWGLMTAATALSFVLAEINRGEDEDEWENIPGHIKDRNMIFNTGDFQLTMPVAYGFGTSHALGNMISEYNHGADPYELSVRMASAMFDNFSVFGNPLVENGDTTDIHPELMLPTIPKILIGPGINKDGLGRQVSPVKYDDAQLDSQNMTRGVRDTVYQDLAFALNDATGGTKYNPGAVDVSPNTIKYWVTNLTGGAGRTSSDILTGAMDLGAGVTPDIENIPVARKFIRKPGVSDSRHGFWNAAKEVERSSSRYKKSIADGDTFNSQKMLDESEHIMALLKFSADSKKMAAAFRDEVQRIQASDLGRAEKRLKIKEMEIKEKRVYDNFLDNFRVAKKKQKGLQ